MQARIILTLIILAFTQPIIAGNLEELYTCPDPANPVQEGCSNDPVAVGKLGILGDGTIIYEHTPSTTGPTEGFEIWSNQDSIGPCLIMGPLVRTVKIDATSCIQKSCTDFEHNPNCKDFIKIKVRAYNHADSSNPSSKLQFGPFSNEVEFLPHICIQGMPAIPDPRPGCPECTTSPNCETQCYEGAPYYLPASKRCSSGFKK